MESTLTATPPDTAFNAADYLVDRHIREGRGDRTAVVTDPDGYRWVLATFKKLAPFT